MSRPEALCIDQCLHPRNIQSALRMAQNGLEKPFSRPHKRRLQDLPHHH